MLLKQIVQRAYGYLISRGIQGQVGWVSGQPDLVGGSLVHGRGLELGNLQDPLQPKPFYDFPDFFLDLAVM